MTALNISQQEPFARPFSLQEGIAAGLTPRVIRGPRFRRVFRGVYVNQELRLSPSDWRIAAQLAVGHAGYLSHVSRIQACGLNIGNALPVHFTTNSRLHVERDGIFAHRTDALPPTDNHGVTPAAALIGYAAEARALDVIIAADWLIHREYATPEEIFTLANDEHWRPGADAIRRLAAMFNGRAASPAESQCRAFVVAAGLPTPEVNAPLRDDPYSPINDLLFRRWNVAVEYEGFQHFSNPAQMKRDIERYALMRRDDVSYVQVYDAKLRHPKALTWEIYKALERRGYRGPKPDFGSHWRALFVSISDTGWKARRRHRRPQNK